MNPRKWLLALGVSGLALLGIAAWLIGTSGPLPVDPAWQRPGDSEIRDGSVFVRFTGTSTLLFSDGETAWMVDGWFSRFGPVALLAGEIAPDPDAIARGLERNEVDRLAAVVPVHSHFDHAMDAPEVARRTGAVVIGSESTANIARGWGLDESRIRVAVDREPIRLGRFTLRLLETRHFEFPDPEVRERALGTPRIEVPLVPPVGAFDYRVGQPYAIHVSHPKGSFLVQGSAGFVPGGFEDLRVDTVFLGIGGLGTQTNDYRERYWHETVTTTGAARVIPIHFDTLTGPIEGPFEAEVRAAAILSSGAETTRAFLAAQLARTPALELITLPRYDAVVIYE